MPIEVQAPDGSIVEFPDGTPDATIQSVMRREFGGPKRPTVGGDKVSSNSLNSLITGRPKLNPAAVADARRRAAATPGWVRAVNNGFTGNWMDELDARGAQIETMLGNVGDRLRGERPTYTGKEAYEAVLGAERAATDKFAAERPVASAALNVAGGLALPGAKFIGGAKGLPGAVARSGAVGAGYGAVAGAGGADEGDRLKGAALGGALGGTVGAAVPMAARGAQKLVGGRARPGRQPSGARQLLMQEGVTLTPGQITGGVGRTTEELSKSIPLVRDVISGAERRGILDLNRAAVNRALAPIGGKLPDDVKPGHDAIGYAQRAIGDVYEAAANGVGRLVPDAPLQPELDTLLLKADDFLDPAKGERAANIVRTRFDRLFNSPAGATGARWKELDSELAELARKATREGSDDAADMFDDARDVLRNLLTRQAPPEIGEALEKANRGWANLVRVQRAARRAEGGVFSPAQLDAAVTGMSTEGQAASGRALLQDLSAAAREVMPARIPDSGTAIRALATVGAGGAGLGAFAPAALLPAAAGLGSVSAAYSRPVLGALNRAATAGSAPRAANPARLAVGNAVAGSAPRLATPAAMAAGGIPLVTIQAGDREVTQDQAGTWVWVDTGQPLTEAEYARIFRR